MFLNCPTPVVLIIVRGPNAVLVLYFNLLIATSLPERN